MENQSPATATAMTVMNTPITASAQKSRVTPPCVSEVVAFAVECSICFKWRKLTEEHFEEFRCNQTKDPFNCTKLPGVTCEDRADINYNEPSEVWVIDKPDIPKTPKDFRRVVSVRGNCSRSEVRYISPQGKNIRSGPEMADYLQEHPEYSHLSLSDFPFQAPKIMHETVPEDVIRNPNTVSSKKKRKLK